jgi:hypothetical protein
MSKLAIPTRKRLELDDASSTITYVGEAPFGSVASDSNWRIFRMQTSGSVLSITWADGNDEFDNVWANRASLSYS